MAKLARSAAALLLALVVGFGSTTASGAPKKKQRTAVRSTGAARSAPVAKPSVESARVNAKEFHLLAEGELPLKAEGAIVLDGATGKALYEKNADAPYFPASTTKIMTALLVIEAGDLDRVV